MRLAFGGAENALPVLVASVAVALAAILLLRERWRPKQAVKPASKPSAPLADAVDNLPWEPAVDYGGPNWLRLSHYFDKSKGELWVRYSGRLFNASTAEFVSLLREVDLLPSWLSLVKAAGVSLLLSQHELHAYASLAFWPWPIPPHYIYLRARLFELGEAGAVSLDVTSPPLDAAADASGGSGVPAEVLAVGRRLPAKRIYAKLTPGAATAMGGNGTLPCTRLDGYVTVEMRKLSFLGSGALESIPGWLLTLVFQVVTPFLWKAFTAALQAVHETDNPWRRRIAEDSTGVYALLEAATSQPRRTGPPAHSSANGAI